MRFLVRFTIFFILFLNACSNHPQNFDGPPLSPLPVLRKYVEQFGALSAESLDGYFQTKISRLSSFTPPKTSVQFSVTLLNTSRAIAFTPGGGFIIISKGILEHLHHESEFMFLLAHEIAHEVLGHTHSENLFSSDAQAREILELQADQYASSLLSMAGINPSYGLQALSDAHDGFLEEQYSSVYPSLEVRRDALTKVLSDLPFQDYPPEENSNFLKIKRSL